MSQVKSNIKQEETELLSTYNRINEEISEAIDTAQAPYSVLEPLYNRLAVILDKLDRICSQKEYCPLWKEGEVQYSKFITVELMPN